MSFEIAKYIYFQIEGVNYRRIKLNNKWSWFRKIEMYQPSMKRFTEQWESFTPDEKMVKLYFRLKKLERINHSKNLNVLK